MPPPTTLTNDIKNVFGKSSPPPGIDQYSPGTGLAGVSGLSILLSNALKITVFAAGIFSLINFLISGIEYIGSSGKPETLKKASSRIWMSLLGLVIIASAFVLAALIGLIFYNDASAILIPSFWAP